MANTRQRKADICITCQAQALGCRRWGCQHTDCPHRNAVTATLALELLRRSKAQMYAPIRQEEIR